LVLHINPKKIRFYGKNLKIIFIFDKLQYD